MLSRNRFLVWIALATWLAVMVTGCGGGGSGSSGGGSLIVVGMTPADGGVLNPMLPPNAVRSHELKIFFSANPDPATILDAAEFNGLSANVRFIDRSLTRVNGWAFLGGVDALGRTPAEIDPSIDPGYAAEIAADDSTVLRFIYDPDGQLSTADALAPDQYTIIISSQVTNRGGNPILEPFCGSFTSGPDVYEPVVRFDNPPDGAAGVSINTTYVFEFNESVVPASVLENPPPGAVSMTAQALGGPGGGPTLAITGTTAALQSNGCRFVFTPDSSLPGSSPGASVVVTATIAGGQVRDADGNTMMNPHSSSFTMEQGPTISNNPAPPNALWFGSTSPNAVGVVGINSVGADPFSPLSMVETDGDGFPTPNDDNQVIATSINRNVGTPVDIAIGQFINPNPGPHNCMLGAGTIAPSISFPTFPNPPAPLPLGSSQGCFPDFCGNLVGNVPNFTNADLGNRVYIADSDNNLIRVLNGNTSLEIEQFAVPDPAGIAITGNLESLLVSNFSTNSVSLFDIINGPAVFVKEITFNPQDPSLGIGRGPDAIAAQPGNEDIFVINKRDESVSIMSVAGGFEVRKVVSSNIGPDPIDVAVTWRQPPWIPSLGTQTYFAYITNRGGDSISVFESGPSFPMVIGPDDIRIVLEGAGNFTINQPTKVHADLATGIYGDGLYYLNSGEGTVGHLSLATIGPPPSPYFPNPSPNRTWGQISVTSSFGPSVRDFAMGDNVFPCFGTALPPEFKNQVGQIFPPIRGYVATGSSIRVFDATTAIDLGIEIPLQGVNLLKTYFKQ